MAQNNEADMTFKNRRRANRAAGFVFCALAAMLAGGKAQAAPNFSGEWKLSASKSDFGPMPPPASRTDKITHADPKLNVTTTQSGSNGEATFELKYTTDGTETTNDLRGNSLKSTSKWDGDTLVLTTKGSLGGNEITLADKWNLSDGGKTLTIARHITVSQGEFDQKIVLEKQ
jgi:hypothetical protein